MIRQLFIEYIEQHYQKPYREVCLGDFDLEFIPAAASTEKYKYRSTWVASFFLNLFELEAKTGMEFFPVMIEIYLDDETGEFWLPPNPNKKLTAQEKLANRKERRQNRRNTR